MSARQLLASLLLLLLVIVGLPAWAGEPPSEPILRIETGMHTAMIGSIAVDEKGRFLVTGSDDKSARVWDLRSGELLSVLRLPIGKGSQGKIYAVAMAPDGGTVAVGGHIGWDFDGKASIYLFDRATGRMLRRIGNLDSTVNHLAFSLDGCMLAAALSENGIRVFRSADGAELMRDAFYGDSSYSVDFDTSGRLVASAVDGFLRLYGADQKLQAKVKAPGGKKPYFARFSPDGSKVAVGYMDSTRVDVFSDKNLTPLYSPSTKGVGNGSLSIVAWSAEGRFLYAGGMWVSDGSFPIRRWEDAGRGTFRDLATSTNTLVDLAHLSDGSMAWASQDPAWGLYDATGRSLRKVTGFIADFRSDRSQRESLQVDASGSEIRFGYEYGGESPAAFDLGRRRLSLDPAASPGHSLARITGLAVTDWKNTTKPLLGRKALPLEAYETSRSLAIAPDARSFVLGTGWYLRSFSNEGVERWNTPIIGDAYAVNLSGDGRLVVAAFGDGTIRWYRASDGQELLAFFPHADRKRWVLYTPSGYYDASPGGEDLIGWHLNRGKDTSADFFPASRFRDKYRRPDVIDLVLSTLDEAKAVAQADTEAGRRAQTIELAKILPPVATILSPSDGAEVTGTEVSLRVNVRSASGAKLTALRLLVDGRVVSTARDLSFSPTPTADGEIFNVKVLFPGRDCLLSVVPEAGSLVGEAMNVRLKAPKPVEIDKPRLYMLAVGVSAYTKEELRLDYAAKDAQDLAAAFQAQKGLMYADVQVRLLTDGQATKDAVLDGLEWLRRQTTSRDVAVLMLAGHGVNDPGTGRYYFLPSNADPTAMMRTMVPQSDIRDTLSSIAGKVVLFLDTCHAGNVLGNVKTRGANDVNGFVNDLIQAENGVVVFTAATGRQASQESETWGHGAFTKAVIEGLSGKADHRKTGRITITMLDYYIAERVKELTNGTQSPATAKPATIPDFPLAAVR